MRFFILFSLCVIVFGSCNVVQYRADKVEKKLEKKEITAYVFEDDSLSLKYWKGGSGPVIMFVHGFGGDALMAWEKELEFFSKTNTVIAPDLLWFGQSKSSMEPNLVSETEAMIKLLDHLKVDSVILVGQSYGGFVIIDMAKRDPERVKKLVVANSPGPTFNTAELQKVCSRYNVKSVDELFVFDEPEGVQRLIDLSSYKKPQLPNFILRQSYEKYFDQNHEELIQLMQSLPSEQKRYTDISFLSGIPILVIWGENDEIFPLSEGKRFVELANANLVVIPKCGHAPQVDDHKAFLKILDDFLSF